jgi:hypothetical protein
MSTPLTRSQRHVLDRKKAHTRALRILKRYYLHRPEDGSGHYCYKARKNKRGKLRYAFVYNVPNTLLYIDVLNGEFRGKYRVYRTN